MTKFTQRTEAPTSGNAYYYANNPFYASGYGLPNCTCYAWGRFWECQGSAGSRPRLSLGNAEDWWGYTSDGYQRGQTPRVGAVICWRKGQAGNNSDGAGHVEIVEAVNDDGTIVTTGSAWNGYLFRTKKRNPTSNWDGGDYIFQGFIYNPVTFDGSGGGTGTIDTSTNSGYIWAYFMEKIGNEYGVAGLIGNLDAESGLYPDRVQGDVPYSSYSQEYTAMVDSGELGEWEFVNAGPNGGGYGLAQWTYYTRKQALYDMYKSGGYSSIGSIELACDYLWYELQNSFAGVLSVLKSATSVRQASDKVLHDFENPADQSEAVEIKRASMGQVYYDMYSGLSPDPGNKKRRGLPLWLMYIASRRRV